MVGGGVVVGVSGEAAFLSLRRMVDGGSGRAIFDDDDCEMAALYLTAVIVKRPCSL